MPPQIHMSRRAIGVGLISIIVVFLATTYPTHADTVCGPQTISVTGNLFSSTENSEYSPEGFLQIHFHNNLPGLSFGFGWHIYNDTCGYLYFQNVNQFNYYAPIPGDVSDWSVRFTSISHFDIWDDQHSVILVSQKLDPSSSFGGIYPDYANISITGYSDSGNHFISRGLPIKQNSAAPIFENKVSPSVGCSAEAEQDMNLFNEGYQRAEYVNGLLRVHLQLGSNYTGANFNGAVFGISDPCVVSPAALPQWWTMPQIYFPGTAYLRYFSIRFTTPTHYIVWDDEHDVQVPCPGCTGDLNPQNENKYVYFASADGNSGGNTKGFVTAPLPPVEPATTTPACIVNCYDNVLFLPGIEGSRLYRPDYNGGTDTLWEPNSSADVSDLFLNPDGSSARFDVYTKDVIDELPTLSNIYKSFLVDIDSWKNTDHIIADYGIAPYDWRLSLNDIIDYGHQMSDGRIYYSGDLRATSTPYIIQTLRRLAQTSRSGKVTVVAHSNGGLVAKALIKKLKDTSDPLLDKIDTLVLVDVPQVGTPEAIGAALNGYNQALPKEFLPFLLDDQTARVFAANSPMAHHLLPSAAYFSANGITTHTPPITFDDGSLTQSFVSAYGHAITNGTELRNFLLGHEGRLQPDFNDTQNPSKLSAALISYAETTHAALDDDSVIPSSINVHEIGGWGNDTLSSIRYYTGTTCIQVTTAGTCSAFGPTLQYDPQTVIDGDGTVITSSSLAMSTSSPNVKRWWVDLKKYNSDHPISTLAGLLKQDHKNILEVSDLRDLIKGVVISDIPAGQTYVFSTQPLATDGKRLLFKLHSPLALSVTDSQGNEISEGTSTVPQAKYSRFGEVQFISVPASANPTVHLRGYATGSFTLEVDEVQGGTAIASTTFAAIPTTSSTEASMSFLDGTIANASLLAVDENGDGATDQSFTLKLDTVVLPDVTPPEIKLIFSTSTNALSFIGMDDRDGIILALATTTFPVLKKNQKMYQGIATTTVTARDQGGNITSLVYTEKLPSPDHRDSVTLKFLVYNGATTTLANTNASYKWRIENSGAYRLFASFIQTAATSTESHWRPKKQLTVIMQKPQDIDDGDTDDDADIRPIKVKVRGMVIPFLTTNKGAVEGAW